MLDRFINHKTKRNCVFMEWNGMEAEREKEREIERERERERERESKKLNHI